ncbi:spinster family MFS transporter [Flavisphingomonas formosensis]|uniref:spinster family MFS transporter n=1 Tax=Flavisphingomonas formosensis TaxID=861534 RepID=UPI001E28AE6F|nr:MFS transporter [Sphingomonas formosensis]
MKIEESEAVRSASAVGDGGRDGASTVAKAWSPSAAQPAARRTIGLRNRWAGLGILFIVALFNYIDRTILSILQVPIKADLHLSDSEIGTLTGMAFALFYTFFGVPIARLADRSRRKVVIAVSLGVWSLMTALTGLAGGFLSLLFLRVGVAIGEAGSVPATHSILSDLFSSERRGNALSTWGLSMPVGTMIGFISAGWLTHSIGWREAFAVVGIAGLVLVPLLLLTLAEPQRGRYDPPAAAAAETISTGEALRILAGLRSFRMIVLGAALTAYVQYVMLTWNAPFYVRVHHMALGDVAFYLALLNGLGGGVGLYLGGTLSDWVGRRDRRLSPLVPAVAAFLIVPFALGQYFVASSSLSLLLGIVPAAATLIYYAPTVAISHTLVSPRMRAFTSAMLVLIINLIGMGLGPLVTGALSDLLVARFGMVEDSLRYAMGVSMFVAIAAGLLFWRASHHIGREMATRASE